MGDDRLTTRNVRHKDAWRAPVVHSAAPASAAADAEQAHRLGKAPEIRVTANSKVGMAPGITSMAYPHP